MPSFENMESFGYTLLQKPLEGLNIIYPYNKLDEYQKIVNESNQLRISNKKLTDTNCNLKERIESMDKHQTIGLSNLEKEISRVIADNKSFINYFAVIKSELSNTISNALKKE